ncbi:DMT family transporter [Patescibacteria group bacterium]|nr:DMT family transporter [Patescibacteria group bacterium]
MSLQIIFVFLYVLFISFSSIVTKSALRKKNNPISFIAFHNLAGALIVLPLIFWDHRLPAGILPWLFLLLGTLTSLLGDYFYFKSMSLEEVSVLTLVFRLRLVLVFILGAFFYNETVTPNKIMAMVFVTLGSIVINFKKGKFHFSKGVMFAIASNIFLGAMFVVDKKIASQISVPIYSFINFSASGLFFLTLSLKRHQNSLTKVTNNVLLAQAIMAGCLLSLASLSRRYAFIHGEISFATPLLNLSMVLTMFLAILMLGERKKIFQKITGAILVITGALILG